MKVVRIKDFLAVVAEDEWTAVRAARALKAQWSEGRAAGAGRADRNAARRARSTAMKSWSNKGDAGAAAGRRKGAQGQLFLADAEPRLDRPLLRGRRRARRRSDGVDRLAGHARQSQHLCPVPRLAAREGAADLSRRLRLLRHERPRGCRGRRRDPVARGRAPGARAMVARGRAWLGPQRSAATARYFRRRRCATAASSTGAPRCGFRRRPGTAQHSAARARRPPGSTMCAASTPA